MTPPGQAMTGSVDGSAMPLPYAPVRSRGLSPTLSGMARTPSDASSFIRLETPGSGSGSGPQSDLPFEVDAQQWAILHQYRAMAATTSGETVVMETVMASPGAIAAQQAQMQAERLQTAMIGAEALTERNRTLEQNLLQNSLQSQQQTQDILGAASQMMQQHQDTRSSWEQTVENLKGEYQ